MTVRSLLAIAVGISAAGSALASDYIIVQSTTSTANSGLYEAILPRFRAQSGTEVRVVAVGTGQALKNAANCDGDVLLVHARAAEQEFVTSGFGTARFDVMYNDFVLVGPSGDPAEVSQTQSAADALDRIAERQAVFVSRGDDSGTHKAETGLWRTAPDAQSSRWYRELGAGMGDIERCGGDGRLYPDGSCHVAQFREPWCASGSARRRSCALQPVWGDCGVSRTLSACEGRCGTRLRGLAYWSRRTKRDCGVSDKRHTAFRSKREVGLYVPAQVENVETARDHPALLSAP